jgi:hypothetical protein
MVGHLRGDGRMESADVFEDRLMAETRVADGMLDGLFAATISLEDRHEILAEAYRVQARKRAFRLDES